jgi:hypothetical protein
VTEERNKFTAQQFIDAIPKSAGIISAIAARVGCDWHTCKKYITSYPTIAQAYADECERVTDLAETELIKLIQGGDLSAVKYYLSTKGKGRGYVERQEVTGKDGEKIKITVRLEDDD